MSRTQNLTIVPVHWALVVLATVTACLLYFGIAVFLLRAIASPDESWLVRVVADAQHINLGSYICFAIAMAILLNRYFHVRAQHPWITGDRLLSSEHHLVLQQDGLELRRQLKELNPASRRAIPLQILDAGLQQSRVAWTPSAVSEAIKTRTDTILGQIDSEYSMIRYLIWAIPSIGFCGTVYGLGAAIGAMRTVPGVEKSDDAKMQEAITNLFTAFDTTLVALVLSLVLMLVFHYVQSREDSFVVNSLDWCLRRFALRMHDGKETT